MIIIEIKTLIMKKLTKCPIIMAFMLLMAISCDMDNKSADKSPINIPPSSLATPVSPMKTDTKGTIKSSFGSIYYEDSGEGGLPVVFVHSFGGSTLHWEAQVNHLKKSRRVITLDLRGHGRSDAPNKMEYAIDSLATDIAAVVDSLNINRFVLVGHSMGGAAVIAYAGAHPQRIAGLLLAGTSGKSSAKEAKPIIASLESKDYDKVMESYMKGILTNAKPEVDALEREGMKRLSKETSLSIIKAIFQFDPLIPLKRYKGSMLIVATPEENQPTALYKQMPNIPHKIMTGTSHWMHMDKPEEFNQILDDFLKTVDAEKK